ncbi:transcriptional regulator, TetR family [Monaibacterium marinum]|uniref:Transcriptional regulator, TetR family n=1 Tax=Pontivivens marinum TaxID=1690039 RepID=A0A2C9CNX5_9RHOB|nr:TetR-like C-terminal domain-containing protein [Monaibacterium marinum]SOH93231.1 transcriptional regulator, TetR family [Monaibacterium marinum]
MSTEKQPAGRPRDTEAAGAIKAATLKLVRERGYGKVSIAAIAAEANVARQTLYNRWNTKANLVLDAVFEETAQYADTPQHDPNQSSKSQLERFLAQVFTHLTENGDPIRALIAAAQDDHAFRQVFSERFVKPREKMVTDLLRNAQNNGEIAPTRNVEMLSSFVHGAFWYALLNGDPVDNDLARNIAGEIFTHVPDRSV